MIDISSLFKDSKMSYIMDRFSMVFEQCYSEPQRFYHTKEHINSMLESYLKIGNDEDVILAILFHDIVYDPKRTDNEERSVEYMVDFFKPFGIEPNPLISEAILSTQHHSQIKSYISEILINLDLEILFGSMEKFMEYEKNIRKEYQFVPFEKYIEKRVEVLKKLNVSEERVEWVKNHNPTIGVYAGSFNPFHKGHLNILQKAEMIFDKVIIARGVNPKKDIIERFPMPECLEYHQIDEYFGLLTEYLETIENPVLIRGLRNTTDVHAELTQYRYLQDLMPEIRVVTIFCDSEFEHISSSDIRALQKYNKGDKYLC